MVGGAVVGIGGEIFAAFTFANDQCNPIVVFGFDVVVGAVFDLTDDLQLPLGPTAKAADAGDAILRIVGVGNDAGDPGCH